MDWDPGTDFEPFGGAPTLSADAMFGEDQESSALAASSLTSYRHAVSILRLPHNGLGKEDAAGEVPVSLWEGEEPLISGELTLRIRGSNRRYWCAYKRGLLFWKPKKEDKQSEHEPICFVNTHPFKYGAKQMGLTTFLQPMGLLVLYTPFRRFVVYADDAVERSRWEKIILDDLHKLHSNEVWAQKVTAAQTAAMAAMSAVHDEFSRVAKRAVLETTVWKDHIDMEGTLQMKIAESHVAVQARELVLRDQESQSRSLTPDYAPNATGREWHSYYFSLVRSCLLMQSGDEVIGVIYLKYTSVWIDAHRVRGGKYQFRIQTPTTTYYFRCKHLASMSEWLFAVTSAPKMAVVTSAKEILSDLQQLQDRKDTLECALQHTAAFEAVKRALVKKEDKAALHVWQDIEALMAEHEGENLSELATAQKLIVRAQVLFPATTQLHGFQDLAAEDQLVAIQQLMIDVLTPSWIALQTKANWDKSVSPRDEPVQPKKKLDVKQVKLVLRERLPASKSKKAKYRGREIKTRTAILTMNSKSNSKNQIGRGEESRLFKIADVSVSRAHGRFDWKNKDALTYVDLGSQGGTRLNGKKIESSTLTFGDVLQLSKHVTVTVTRLDEVSDDELWEKQNKGSCVVS